MTKIMTLGSYLVILRSFTASESHYLRHDFLKSASTEADLNPDDTWLTFNVEINVV